LGYIPALPDHSIYSETIQRSQCICAPCKKTNWVNHLLPDDSRQEGLLNYLEEKYTDGFDHVAEVKQNLKAMHKMDTIITEAMVRSAKLRDKKLSEVRVHARNMAKLDMELDKTTLKQLRKGPVPSFGTYIYHGKGKLVKKCKYWTADVGEEMEHALEQHNAQLIEQGLQDSKPSTCLPYVDYQSPANETGTTCIAGGNHGDVAFCFLWIFIPANMQGNE
jgi:hypothetical protein